MKIILVTLVHNRKHLVGRAIQSAVDQTLPKDKWTHLVINNASTDGADKVCEVFAKKYGHIHYRHNNKNLGQQKAYNEALYNWIPDNDPSADIMVVLDSDDELMPNALYEVDRMYKEHPKIGATYSGFSLMDKNGAYIVKDHGKAKMVPNQFSNEGQKALRKMFVAANPCGHLRSYRISALLDIGGFPTERKFATDFCVFGAIMMKYSVVKIPKVLYKFYQHGDQIQSKFSPQQTEDWKYYQRFYKEKFEKMGII